MIQEWGRQIGWHSPAMRVDYCKRFEPCQWCKEYTEDLIPLARVLERAKETIPQWWVCMECYTKTQCPAPGRPSGNQLKEVHELLTQMKNLPGGTAIDDAWVRTVRMYVGKIEAALEAPPVDLGVSLQNEPK